MSARARSSAGAAALALGLAALIVVLLLWAVQAVGTDEGLYFSEQVAAGVLETAGLSEGELRELDHRLADYLRGDRAALESNPPFNAREMAHMADCFELFALLRKVISRLIPWAVLLIAGGAWLMQDRRRARLCAWLSPLIVLMPLGAFAIFAAADFDSAFTLFHRLLFRNDLWLLDPATDILIRICPESMFMHMGVRIAALGLLGMLAVSGVAALLTFLWPRGRGRAAWRAAPENAYTPKRMGGH